MGMEIRKQLRAKKEFEQKKIGELTVAEFRDLMASILKADRAHVAKAKDANTLSQWPYQIVRGMGNPEY